MAPWTVEAEVPEAHLQQCQDEDTPAKLNHKYTRLGELPLKKQPYM